eukprot:Anaeramoba_flamelloidesa1055892_18.p1 GENE.a1055892_18~~a1055892_18.p1  ORF type:complete len:104 (+),score=3.83 a1055892_18:462-773(+)
MKRILAIIVMAFATNVGAGEESLTSGTLFQLCESGKFESVVITLPEDSVKMTITVNCQDFLSEINELGPKEIEKKKNDFAHLWEKATAIVAVKDKSQIKELLK